MPTLRDIQQLVNEAQQADRPTVETILWPEINNALGQCTDIKWKYREDLAYHIYKRLNEQTLEGRPVQIDVEKLLADLQEGKLQVPEPVPEPEVGPWAPL